MTHPTLTTPCPGCGAQLAPCDGPVHPYMTSSPACHAQFSRILAAEYSSAALQATHRLSVDTFAVQHPGTNQSRRQIQSVGLHLARLCLQLDTARPPKQTNDIMLGLSRHKHTLIPLPSPARFTRTAADVAPHAGSPQHPEQVRLWAQAAWQDWAAHHAYIRSWISQHAPHLL